MPHDYRGIGTGLRAFADLKRQRVWLVAAMKKHWNAQLAGKTDKLDDRRLMRRKNDGGGMQLQAADTVFANRSDKKFARSIAVPRIDPEIASDNTVGIGAKRRDESRIRLIVVAGNIGEAGDASLVDAALLHYPEQHFRRMNPSEADVAMSVRVDDHLGVLPCAILASSMYFQTLFGVSGISITCTVNPACSRALSIAPATAAIGPEIPDSPAPLAPNGLNGDGVSSWLVSKLGRSTAVGIV